MFDRDPDFMIVFLSQCQREAIARIMAKQAAQNGGELFKQKGQRNA